MSALLLADRVLRRLYAACAALAALSVVMIAILVLISIVSRAMGVYTPGMTEGAGYGMAAAGSLGLAYTFMHGGHVRVDLLISRLTERTRSRMELLALSITMLLIGYAAWYLCRLVLVSFRFQDRSAGSDGLLLWMPQLPIAFGFVVFTVSIVHTIALGFAGRSGERTANENER